MTGYTMIEQPTKTLIVQKPPRPPGCVLWFERLFYISALLSAIGIAFDWAKGMNSVAAAAMSALLALQLMLIWLAARRRKNWARYLLLGLFLAWTIGGIISSGLGSQTPNWQPPDISIQAVKLAKILLETVGLILVLTGKSRQWFHQHIGRRDPNRPW